MRGTIQQRGKESWRIRVYVGLDGTGTKRYVPRTIRGTRREAERELSRLLDEVDEGRFVACVGHDVERAARPVAPDQAPEGRAVDLVELRVDQPEVHPACAR